MARERTQKHVIHPTLFFCAFCTLELLEVYDDDDDDSLVRSAVAEEEVRCDI